MPWLRRGLAPDTPKEDVEVDLRIGRLLQRVEVVADRLEAAADQAEARLRRTHPDREENP